VDFYDLKGDLESLFDLTRAAAAFVFAPLERPGLHPGQCAGITRNGQPVGCIGLLHPGVQAELDLAAPLLVAEIDLSAVLEGGMPQFSEISRFPEVRRDLAVIVDKMVPAAELMANVRAAAGTYLKDLTLFDVYEGKGIDPKRKSLAFGLTFRDLSRTLSDEDVNFAIGQVLDSLKKNFNAELRN